MTLIFFKYFLPILLGYTIFVGIAGRYTPFRRPKAAIQRPIWFLGLWTGVATAIIVIAGLQFAYRMPLNELSILVKPGFAITAAALVPGIIGYFWYRWRVRRAIAKGTEAQQTNDIDSMDADQLDNTLASDALVGDELDEAETEINTGVNAEASSQVVWSENNDNLAVSEMGMDETLSFDVDSDAYDEPVFVSDSDAVIETDTGTPVDAESEMGGEIDAAVSGDIESVVVGEIVCESIEEHKADAADEIDTSDTVSETEAEIATAAVDESEPTETIEATLDVSEATEVTNDIGDESESEPLSPADSEALARTTAELTASRLEISRLQNELSTYYSKRPWCTGI